MTFNAKVDLETKKHSQASKCLIPMGITSDNVANRFNVTRRQQDELGVLSHAKAAKAIKSGRFKE